MTGKLEKILKGTALAGSLFIAGCGTIMKGGLRYASPRADFRAVAAANDVADAVGAYEQGQAARSNTTVVVNSAPPQQQEEKPAKSWSEWLEENQKEMEKENPKDFIFAFSRYEDKNKNGRVSLDEYEGRGKTLFRPGEPVEFVLYGLSKTGEIRFSLEDEKGNILRDVTGVCEKGRSRIRDPPTENNSLPPGKYTAKWHRDGIYLGETKIEYRETTVQ